ncbi:MAG TPA: prephenate dehydratase domain-containing protein [Candidatus Elarobacter sp.]|nr:prephenate dehydratase domain-containing protein [Candidatus Elarobacter sp.]
MTPTEWAPDLDRDCPVVAFQGAHGAFSDEVITTLWQGRATTRPARDFASVVRAVVDGHATHAVLPIENTTIGRIAESCAAIDSARALVTLAEIDVPVIHCLMGVPGSSLALVRRALSHPAALAQCRGFFEAHHAIEAVSAYDTAGAAVQVAELAQVHVAAIAPARAAALYGLAVLARDIQDRANNVTRFAIVAHARGAHAA